MMRPCHLPIGFLIGILVATAVAYVPSLRGEFQFDDVPVIERIERHDVAVGELLLGRGADRPVTYFTLLVDYEIAGLDVRVFHATNILLHLVAATLVFFFTRTTLVRLGYSSPDGLAVAVAGLFALHPIQTQSVSYVIQRSEILASIFYLATLCFLLASEPPSPRGRRVAMYLGALVMFVLGMGAKQMIVTAPFAYVLCRACVDPPHYGAGWKRIVFRFVPIGALATLVAWAMVSGATDRLDVGFSVPLLSPMRYALTQLAVIPSYLRMLGWPAGQNIDHDFPLSQGIADARTFAGAVMVLTLAGFAAWACRATRLQGATPFGPALRAGGFGLAWFLLLLLPTSSVVPLADVFVEHRVYLASWGIFLGGVTLVGAFLSESTRGRTRSAATACVVAVTLGALFAATWQRNEIWGSRLALWTDAATNSPNKARARANHAHALRVAGRQDEAIREYDAALHLVGEKPELLRGLAGALYETSRVAEAIGLLQRARELAPADSRILSDLAVMLAVQGRFDEADRAARQALAADSRNALAHLVLGNIQLERGDARVALEAFAAAERLAPHLGAPALNAALARARMGDQVGACVDLDRARRTEKGDILRVQGLARELGCPQNSP
jgi:protein O-mannosyl-transferase